MKIMTYKCDRCGAELGECGAAVERAKFVTQEIVLYRMRFFKNWKDDTCLMCIRDAREQKKCKLRKTLMNIAPTAALPKDGLCAYIDVVAGNELGEYI